MKRSHMALNLATLEARYIDFCQRHEVLPNNSILSGFTKDKLQKSCLELCSLQVSLDLLKDVDFPPLIDTFSLMDSSEIDAIDILNESPCVLNQEYVMSLMRAVNQKLRVVDIHDSSFGKEFLQDLSCNGLMCQVLNLRSSHIRKLNMTGNFMQLHTLNLDFSISLTSFRDDCFSCMPNLLCLSMCETRVSNLWTTSVALSKLPSLVELRFQNCLCCNDTRPCPVLSSEKNNYHAYEKTGVGHLDMHLYNEMPSTISEGSKFQNSPYSHIKESFENLVLADNLVLCHEPLEYTTEESSSDDSEVDFKDYQRRIRMGELVSSVPTEMVRQTTQENEVTSRISFIEETRSSISNFERSRDVADVTPKKFVSHHPSPICFEKYYREYMITSLPRLEVLDNIPIKRTDRDMARTIFSQYYEYLPYNQPRKESLINILQRREMGTVIGQLGKPANLKQPYPLRKSHCFFTRSICAAKVGSSAWPLIHSVSKMNSISREETKSFRPRQFEYHPSNSSLMVFGTLDGEIVVINHESGELVGHMPSIGTLNSVLGLCWLRRHPSKLIAGSDNGSLQLYDIRQMPSTFTERYCSANFIAFDDFEQLTSVHVNSTDEQFIASGYSKNIALYDIASGRRLQVIPDMHHGHINVVKFAHHSPSIFATSSFDRDVKMWDLRQRPLRPCYTSTSSRGNVMVCFSPDDHYLLSSAVDNEVKQLLAVDGRVHTKFEIASTGSAQNYTRSYYLNGRDYVISGSCDEHVVRICCARTGRRLRDVSLETRGSGNSLFVQSLRGDPFREFNMSVLAAYMRPSSKFEIIKINLMASIESNKEYSHHRHPRPSHGMGG